MCTKREKHLINTLYVTNGVRSAHSFQRAVRVQLRMDRLQSMSFHPDNGVIGWGGGYRQSGRSVRYISLLDVSGSSIC